MNNNNRKLIHSLLYQSLIEIREAAYENKGMKGIFKISDVFHNVPLQLEKAASGERDYQSILDDITKRAKKNGCSDWLKNVIQQLDKQGSPDVKK